MKIKFTDLVSQALPKVLGGNFTSLTTHTTALPGETNGTINLSLTRVVHDGISTLTLLQSEDDGFNATVPEDGTIQPAQAYADAMTIIAFSLGNQLGGASDPIDLSDLGMTVYGLDNSNALNYVVKNGGDFSGNDLNADSVNYILNAAAFGGESGKTLDLSGGTNATPTGQGLLDQVTLEGLGWTVLTN